MVLVVMVMVLMIVTITLTMITNDLHLTLDDQQPQRAGAWSWRQLCTHPVAQTESCRLHASRCLARLSSPLCIILAVRTLSRQVHVRAEMVFKV